MKSLTYFLALSHFVANLGDFFTTFIALLLGGVETNHIINSGLTIFFGVKLLLPLVYTICGLLINSYAEKHNYQRGILGIRLAFLYPTIMFTIATINNVFVIISQTQAILAGNAHFGFFK